MALVALLHPQWTFITVLLFTIIFAAFPCTVCSFAAMSRTTASQTANNEESSSSSWSVLLPDALVSAPCLIEQTLCQPDDQTGQPQLAAHVDYATAVLDAWRDEAEEWSCDVEWCDITYQPHTAEVNTGGAQQQPLYGHWIRRRPDDVDNQNDDTYQTILLFHTGAGPHDLFLLWKAASLVAQLDSSSIRVLIADVLSDENGWAWSSDRTRYQQAREELEQNGLWRSRVEAAVRQGGGTVSAAMGWCLGGRAIFELAQLPNPPSAMVTFHGVFPKEGPLKGEAVKVSETQSEILVCHGVQDPFVPAESLENALYVASPIDTFNHIS